MKLGVFFAILGLAIGMSVYTLRPEWLAESDHWREWLMMATTSNTTTELQLAQDPGTALNQVHQELISYAEAQLRSGTTGTPEQSRQFAAYLQQVEELRQRIGDSLGNADRALLHAHFTAAKVCPADYRARFEELVQQTISTAASEDVEAEARMLEFLVKHPLQTAVTRDVRDDLREFARRYPRSPWGISLFSAAATQLWLAQQTRSAEQVLTLGLQLYEEHPGRVELVRLLVDQGHRPPPKSQISQADWETMERAIDARGGGFCLPCR